MKHFCYFFMFSLYFSSFSQNPMIFEEDWSLNKIVIEGIDYFPPLNAEITSISLFIGEGEPGDGIFTTNVCNYGGGSISFTDAAEFIFDDFITSLIMCELNENNNFEYLYFYQFFQQNATEAFTYSVTQNGNLKTLVLTNAEGWQAFYSHQELSIHNNHLTEILLYPNPAKDHINITTKNTDFKGKAIIYNATGQIVSITDYDSGVRNAIALPNLSDGIYYLRLSNNDNTYHSKFIIN